MTSLEFGADSPRASDADRERALDVLREGAVRGRISQDTFVRRTDAVLQAQWQRELHAVLHDLPARKPRGRWFVDVVGRISAFPGLLRRAWQAERLPELLLPLQRQPLSIGRAPGSMLRLNHYTVSRMHAQLRMTSGGGWKLRDLGSSNGTWVNGSRVTGSLRVQPGDQVRFGQVAFRLVTPQFPAPRLPAPRLPDPQFPDPQVQAGPGGGPGAGAGGAGGWSGGGPGGGSGVLPPCPPPPQAPPQAPPQSPAYPPPQQPPPHAPRQDPPQQP